MLLLACSVAAAGAAAPPSKPELRPAVHKRVHQFPPPDVQLPNALSRIVNPNHPEPMWLSTTELWVLRIIPYCIFMGVWFVIHSFLIKSRNARWIGDQIMDLMVKVLHLCEPLGDPCGKGRSHLIIKVMVVLAVAIQAFCASVCATPPALVAGCLAHPLVVRFLLLARARVRLPHVPVVACALRLRAGASEDPSEAPGKVAEEAFKKELLKLKVLMVKLLSEVVRILIFGIQFLAWSAVLGWPWLFN